MCHFLQPPPPELPPCPISGGSRNPPTFCAPQGFQQEVGFLQDPLFDGSLSQPKIAQGRDGEPSQMDGFFPVAEGNSCRWKDKGGEKGVLGHRKTPQQAQDCPEQEESLLSPVLEEKQRRVPSLEDREGGLSGGLERWVMLSQP